MFDFPLTFVNLTYHAMINFKNKKPLTNAIINLAGKWFFIYIIMSIGKIIGLRAVSLKRKRERSSMTA